MEDDRTSTSFKLKMLLMDFLHISNQLGITFYLVGGSVRDALLKRPFFDLDFVFDGDVETLFKHLKDKYAVRQSLLKTLNFEFDVFNIDIAVFRSERYTGHSGLPTLYPGTFDEDLWRRDFTINTAYVKLDETMIQRLLIGDLDFSCVYKAHPNFESDVQTRTLQILHEQSFLEDPTRLLRAIKYIVALDLKFEDKTKKYFDEAVAKRVIEQCTIDRYKGLLYKYMELTAYKEILLLLFQYGLLRGLPSKEFINDRQEVLIQILPKAKKSDFVMLALYEQDLSFIKGINRYLSNCVKEITDYRNNTFDINQTDYMWYMLLKNYKLETLMFLMYTETTSAWEKHKIRYFYAHLRHIKILITGDDLLKMGIPSGEIMGKLKSELLAYKINTGAHMLKLDEIKWIERKYDAY